MSVELDVEADIGLEAVLHMLWCELTLNCNESCSHCYNHSGPTHKASATLPDDTWRGVITDAAELGAGRIRFIGGEPTLHPHLPEFIEHSAACRIDQIELSTNGTLLSRELVDCLARHDVFVSVSLYSDDPHEHDLRTRVKGSHARTMAGLTRLLAAGVRTSAGVILPESRFRDFDRVRGFLLHHGIENVWMDRIRGIGRGAQIAGRAANGLSELCGSCWRGSLCVAPDGVVFPCIMAREFPMGSVLEQSLGGIVSSAALAEFRRRVKRDGWEPHHGVELACIPTGGCSPHGTPCFPGSTPPNPCNPHVCGPQSGPCYPLGGRYDFAGPAELPDRPVTTACIPTGGCTPQGAPCFPGSTPPNPCSPHACGPQTGPCYPLGGRLATGVADRSPAIGR